MRSDTVTLPTEDMRRAMYNAELGDDVYGEDPSVNLLQERAADLMGKESALLVSSGTQGNLVSILAHTNRGNAIVVGDASHIFHYEAMSASTLGGLGMLPIPTEDSGVLLPTAIESVIPDEDEHKANVTLLCLENTHNTKGGRAISYEDMHTMCDLAHAKNLKVHVDGARIFNASVALNTPPAKLVEEADSVTFCLSKGLSCPVGSLVVGSAEFVHKARRWRKALGSGMRQAGVIASAGIVALNSMIQRLAEDHDNAKYLAKGLQDIPGVDVNVKSVDTNIVFFKLHSEETTNLPQQLKRFGILINGSKNIIRMVTHRGINKEDIDYVLQSISTTLDTLY